MKSDTANFFTWLDEGEGKNFNHEKCPQSTLNNSKIHYCTPQERIKYEVTVTDGLLTYAQTGKAVHAPTDIQGINSWKQKKSSEKSKIKQAGLKPQHERWIFVLSCEQVFYVALKQRGVFQHSSFLAGAAVLFAGIIKVDLGRISLIAPYSGHYRPSSKDMLLMLECLHNLAVDVKNVKLVRS
jgi:hypothetical protein